MTRPLCPLPLAVVIETVRKVTGLTSFEMALPGRHWQVSAARAVIVYAARRYTLAGYPEIADGIGMRSHTSVIGANRRMERWLRGFTSQTFPASRREWVVNQWTKVRLALDELVRDRVRNVRDEVAFQAALVKAGLAEGMKATGVFVAIGPRD